MTTIEETLKKISEKSGKPVDTLKAELSEILENFKKIAPTEDENYLKDMSINRLMAQYRKQMVSGGVVVEAIFIASSGKFDMVKKKRDAILKLSNENRDKAVAEGMIDENGCPLYWEPKEKVDKMQDWQKKNLGTKMPETDYRRSLYGILSFEGKFIPMELRLRAKNTDTIPRLFVKTQFNGFKLQTSTDIKAIFNDSGRFDPIYGDELKDNEVISLFNSVYKNKFIALNQLNEFIDANSGEFSPLMIAKVNVVDISTNMTSNNSHIISVSDDTVELEDIFTCWVPEHLPLNFPETSEIYIVGSPSRNDKGIAIGVSGIFVPALFRTQIPTDIKNIDGKSDIVGKW